VAPTRFLCLAWLLSVSAIAAAQTPPPDQTFDALLKEVEAAQVQLVSGKPAAFKALWSHGDDVTLSGGAPTVVCQSRNFA